MIKFSEFAGALYKGMGTKEQEGKFAQELFYNIVDCYSDEILSTAQLLTLFIAISIICAVSVQFPVK